MNVQFKIPSLKSALRSLLTALTYVQVLRCIGAELHAAPASPVALSPAKVKQIKEINKGYQFCAQAAVKEVKTGALKSSDLPKALGICREQFPGAALYLQCKKDLLKDKPQLVPEPQAVASCQKYLTAASFEPTEPIAFFIHNSEAYLAGLGLNQEVESAKLAPPNFNCEPYHLTETNLDGAQYILFGNSPNAFGTIGTIQQKFLHQVSQGLTAAKQPKTKETNENITADNFFKIIGFGRLFAEKKPGGPTAQIAYFPSAPCHFSAPLGDIFSGISAHYLIHPTSKAATPYFGVTYFNKDRPAISTGKLVTEMLKRLGPAYKLYKKNAETVFLAAASFTEFDLEGDPRNVCKSPRLQQFIGIVHSFKETSGRPNYLILANIKNLCDYGDRLANAIGS
ncbi:MAG: hypothetical protein NTV34_19075 [Proteobacteria bacterium]|nr:hypothetical protein [Pseudomonadota bacterium]